MDENPYQAPLADLVVVGVKSGMQEDVRAVAIYQKGILVCILCYLFVVIGSVVAPPVISRILPFALMPIGIAGLVFVFLLSTKVYSTAVGILLAILTFLPCLGILVLLAINGKATNILKQNGHKVGLLGAKLSEFD